MEIFSAGKVLTQLYLRLLSDEEEKSSQFQLQALMNAPRSRQPKLQAVSTLKIQ